MTGRGRLWLLVVVLAGTWACDQGGGGGAPPIDCQPPKPFFLGGICVECLEDQDCPEGQGCDAANACVCSGSAPRWNGQECVGCLDDGDCGEGEVCDDCAAICVALSEPCTRPHVCNAVCTACLKDQDCGEGEVCDLGVGGCVVNDCEDPLPLLFGGECVECLVNGDCPGDLVCNAKVHRCECEDPFLKVTDDGECVECVNSFDCPMGEMCDTKTYVCEPTATGCPPEEPYFWNGDCVECLDDSNCPEKGSSCHLAKHYCLPPPLECDGHTPYEYQGECVQCVEYAHCPEDKICDFNDHKCIDGGGGVCPATSGGTGTHVGDHIGNFALNDCLGNKHVLHDTCGASKAVWLIQVAGWCGACEEYGPMAWEYAQGFLEQGLEQFFVLGEDAGGAPPSQAYCNQYAEGHGFDPTRVLIDPHWQTFGAFISVGGTSLPWDVLLDGDDMLFVWESVDPSFAVLQSELNKLLGD
ncbi:MAG: hypothetical protein FJ098_03780 [Deltaproteobacteria bacterium]|nr:hypothetical protein [Deltaproteobacteria bacterium]